MRVSNATPNVARLASNADQLGITPKQLEALFQGVDLPFLTRGNNVGQLFGHAANVLANEMSARREAAAAGRSATAADQGALPPIEELTADARGILTDPSLAPAAKKKALDTLLDQALPELPQREFVTLATEILRGIHEGIAEVAIRSDTGSQLPLHAADIVDLMHRLGSHSSRVLRVNSSVAASALDAVGQLGKAMAAPNLREPDGRQVELDSTQRMRLRDYTSDTGVYWTQ